MMWLTFSEKFVGSKMLMLLIILSAVSYAAVNGWQVDSNVILDAGDNCQTPTGGAGVCKRISTCEPYAKRQIKYNALRRCSFIGNEEVTCCPVTGTGGGQFSTFNWQNSVDPTVRPTTTSTTTSTTTTTTTTTTISPIVIGDITLTGNEQFFDLSKVLRIPTSTRRPQSNRQIPPVLPNNSQRPIQRTFSWENVNPIGIGGSNNVQWPNQQINARPSESRNVQRIPTRRPVNPDVELFNPNAPGLASQNMVQNPTTNSLNTQPIAVVDNIFEQFQFRPGSDDDDLKVTSTVRNFVDNDLGDDEWAWPTATTVRTTPRITPRTTPSTTTTTTIAPISQSVTTEDWILAALRNASVSFPVTTPLIDVVPISVTPIATPSTTVETVTTRTTNERPSEAACRRWKDFNPAALTFHILDGVPVAPGDYPHMGGLIFPVGGGEDIDIRCGTSLIAEQYVLTAAHCVNDPVAQPTAVRFGVVIWNSTADDSMLPVDVDIESITMHGEYRAPLRYHDVAIIKLRRPVDFTPFIRPACLYSDMGDIDSATPLVVIGWGVTNVQTRSRSEVLLMTNVTTVPLTDCNATHVAQGVQRTYKNGLNEGHYCAFDPELKKDACQADSGGPLQLVVNKESTIVGVVSFGLSCGSAVPSVYARVAYYLQWIESIVWPS